MDWVQFLAIVLPAAMWPAAVVACVWLLRPSKRRPRSEPWSPLAEALYNTRTPAAARALLGIEHP